MSRERHPDSVGRTDLRSLDQHQSWREVYAALEVDPNYHDERRDLRGGDLGK